MDKPPGIAVHPLAEGETGTLLNAVVARFPKIQGVGEEGGLRSGVVHRLDTNTSGVMLFALDLPAWQRFRTAFAEHRIRKTYAAVVAGHPADQGRADFWLKVTRHRPAFVRRVEPRTAGARRCSLSWAVTQRHAHASLIEINLETGFLHQIRATFATLGHPVRGDPVYGPSSSQRPTPAPHLPGTTQSSSARPRMLLHAQTLRLDEIELYSPLPPEFAQVQPENHEV